jgi:hypothetical protein
VRPVYIFWLCWFSVSFVTFLAAEIWGLVTGKGRTLSEAIWHLERFRTGQPIGQWSVGHYWFVAGFFVLSLWLLFHFGFGDWRS